jgi:hypothetical protein
MYIKQTEVIGVGFRNGLHFSLGVLKMEYKVMELCLWQEV